MNWVLIAVLVIVLVGFILVQASRAFRGHARRDFIAYLRELFPGWHIKEHPDRLDIGPREGETGTLFLHNLYRQVAEVGLNHTEAVRGVFAQFAGLVKEATSGQTVDVERDRKRIFPRLVLAEFLTSAQADGIRLPNRVLGDTGLHVIYVLDSEHSMTHINDETLTQLSLTLDTVHPLALSNLRSRFRGEPVRSVIEQNNLSVVKTGDGYDAARLLLVPEHLQDGETLAAAVPDRDTLVLAPAPRNGNWRPLKRLALTAAGQPLLPLLLAVSKDGITVQRV